MQNGSINGSVPQLAVAGMGYWGKNLVRNFSQLGALSVVCDSNAAVEETLAREYKHVGYNNSFASVLSDASIAAVALATPAVTHYEMAKAAMEAGKDVYVEKPLAIEVKEGRALVNRDVFDVTLSQFQFPSGVHAHIFVSWLHPFKEQRLVVVGSEKMAVFVDTAEHKLV